MSDLEITRLCAEAMDIPVRRGDEGTWWLNPKTMGEQYDPLHDDAQAMALVKKFHIHLDKTLRTPDDPKGLWIASNTDKRVSDPTNDLNRAICECVAKMQKAKEPWA